MADIENPYAFLAHVPEHAHPQDARRLFHGRGGLYPGWRDLNIDCYPPLVILVAFGERPMSTFAGIAAYLESVLPNGPWSFYLQKRYQSKAPTELLRGEPVETPHARENHLRFELNLKMQNIGFFCDMRLGRDLIRAHANEKKVLNLFAFTCAFSVCALAGGATQVDNVDKNGGVLKRGRQNHLLNQSVGIDARKASFWTMDVLKSASRFRKKGPYDIVILDPPTFQRGSFVADRDYPKIVAKLDSFTSQNARILACLNQPNQSFATLESYFENTPFQVQKHLVAPPEFEEPSFDAGLKMIWLKKTDSSHSK